MPVSAWSVIWLVSCLFIFLTQENRVWTAMADQNDWGHKICTLVVKNALNIVTNGKVRKSTVAYQTQFWQTQTQPPSAETVKCIGLSLLSGYGGTDRHKEGQQNRGCVNAQHSCSFCKCIRTKLAELLLLILHLQLICAMWNWHCHRQDLKAAKVDSKDHFKMWYIYLAKCMNHIPLRELQEEVAHLFVGLHVYSEPGTMTVTPPQLQVFLDILKL